MVYTEPPVVGPFATPNTRVTTGASYVMPLNCVPVNSKAAAFTVRAFPEPAAALQLIAVVVSHCVDEQLISPRNAVGDALLLPKFNPNNVTTPLPVSGVFPTSTVAKGASYVRIDCTEPICEPTITDALIVYLPLPGATAHTTEEKLVQTAVSHAVDPMMTVGVLPTAPKLPPTSVMLALPLTGAFGGPAGDAFVLYSRFTRGASYVKASGIVPTSPPMVATNDRLPPPPASIVGVPLHARLVALTQMVALHLPSTKPLIAP